MRLEVYGCIIMCYNCLYYIAVLIRGLVGWLAWYTSLDVWDFIYKRGLDDLSSALFSSGSDLFLLTLRMGGTMVEKKKSSEEAFDRRTAGRLEGKGTIDSTGSHRSNVAPSKTAGRHRKSTDHYHSCNCIYIRFLLLLLRLRGRL